MKEFYPYLLESLLETLNNHQIELVDDWKTENQDLSGTLPENTHDKTFAKFNKGKKKSSRILIPFNAPNNINNDIAAHLHNNGGWVVKDYNKGIAVRNVDNYTEESSISDLLKNTNGDKVNTNVSRVRINYGAPRTKTISSNLVDAFNNDKTRAPSGMNIIITRDPYEVAGMATGKTYKSCMKLPEHTDDPDEGLNYEHIQHDLKHQNLAVYLNHSDDNDIDNARSHIMLKRYTNKEGHDIWRPTKLVHGDQIEGFHKAVTDFAENNWPAKPGSRYTLTRGLYKNAATTIET